MAFLNKGIRISLRDERVEPVQRAQPTTTRAASRSFVEHLNRHKTPAVRPAGVHRGRTRTAPPWKWRLQWNDGYNESVFTFANNIHTPEGGTHLVGLRTALTRVINDYGRKNKHLQGQRRRI